MFKCGTLFRTCSIKALVPSCWVNEPEGWFLIPHSRVNINTSELPVRKVYSFLAHGTLYNFVGQSMAFASEIGCIPVIEWFFSELCVYLPPTSSGELVACFMNDFEQSRCGLRNISGGTGKSNFMWSNELLDKVEQRSENDFCWALTRDAERANRFLDQTFLQWHNRADYLVSRFSREKREFRPDISISSVMMNGQERKRRLLRRKNREDDTNALRHAMNRANSFSNDESVNEVDSSLLVSDVIPREMREALEKEHQDDQVNQANKYWPATY